MLEKWQERASKSFQETPDDEGDLGSFIAEKRSDRGLSVKKLSAESDINAVVIKDLEAGYLSTLKKKDLESLSRALDLSAKERHEMYDLAAHGKVPADIYDFVKDDKEIQAFLRVLMDGYPSKKTLGNRISRNIVKLPPKTADKILEVFSKREKERRER